MLLALRFFSINDFLYGPLCLLLLFFIVRNRANRQKDPFVRKIYYRFFYFKIACVLAFTFYTEFIFRGGDTSLYYQSIKNLRRALDDGAVGLLDIIRTDRLTMNDPLTPYFYYDNYEHDFTYGYMTGASNFFVPRLGLIPSYFFGNNYLCINFIFGFFALGGALRLFKFFYHYYPGLKVEFAFAILFMPSVGFWSAGLLKDPVCFGAIGFIFFSILNIFIKKEKIFPSVLLLVASVYLVFNIKVYILLPLLLAFILWIFYDTGKKIQDRTLRNIFILGAILVAVGVSFISIQYITQSDSAASYSLDNLQSRAESQKNTILGLNNIGQTGSKSNFKINTSNIALLIPNSLAATFLRPFPWDIKTPVMAVSFLESFLVTIFIFTFFFKRGFLRFFSIPFSNSIMLLCFTFSISFGLFVGASTSNFGALSRYKIPCIPLFMIFLILIYHKTGLKYPAIFNRIIRIIK